MENPYEKFGAHRCEVRLGHGFAWAMALVFLLICTLAPFWRNLHQFFRGPNGWTPVVELFEFSPETGQTLYEHLRDAEKKIERAAFTEPLRKGLQWVGSAVFREGNRKTAIGRDGWLYFRPAIDAITGYGPLKPEPDTVAKDPTRKPWSGPLGAIVTFNRQLEEFGVELILVPIPVKPMIYPEFLAGDKSGAPITHPDAETFYEKLREGGVEVLDLTSDLVALKTQDREGDAVFLQQDTHWSPRGMKASAAKVSTFLKSRPWFSEIDSANLARFSRGSETLAAPGDLVENLELEETELFEWESATIEPVTDSENPAMTIYDQKSPIVLLGDSFTNIFHQEDLNWGQNAGFAQQLSAELGLTLDTIARNGQASTGVRRSLAVRPYAAQVMRKEKKAVVWAIAARDLFLSESVARDNQVHWNDVEFSTGDPAAGVEWPVVVEGTVSMVSTIRDPATVPYKDALYVVEYENVWKIGEDGAYPLESAKVFHWAFRDKKLLPSANYKVGDTHRLKLVARSSEPKLLSLQAFDESDPANLDLPEALAVEGSVKILERQGSGGVGESRSEQDAARIASISTGAFALLLGAAILLIFRKRSKERAAA